MAEFKQKIDCTWCGNRKSVTVITRQTKHSRSVKVTKCPDCGKQSGVKSTLNRVYDVPSLELTKVIKPFDTEVNEI